MRAVTPGLLVRRATRSLVRLVSRQGATVGVRAGFRLSHAGQRRCLRHQPGAGVAREGTTRTAVRKTARAVLPQSLGEDRPGRLWGEAGLSHARPRCDDASTGGRTNSAQSAEIAGHLSTRFHREPVRLGIIARGRMGCPPGGMRGKHAVTARPGVGNQCGPPSRRMDGTLPRLNPLSPIPSPSVANECSTTISDSQSPDASALPWVHPAARAPRLPRSESGVRMERRCRCETRYRSSSGAPSRQLLPAW